MESRFGFPHITLLWVVATTIACGAPELSPETAVLAVVSPEVLERMRATPHDYFRFINHEWTARVCDVFASDVPQLPTVQLHGDAHVEQYAITSNAWGLDDFDDSTRGPALVDIVRFLGSIELVAQQRGWSRERWSRACSVRQTAMHPRRKHDCENPNMQCVA